MPRVSEVEKQKSHKRILDAAAGLFREKGIETTSVAEVMKAAGMTHGGFYRHFSSKDELVAAAFRNAVDEVVERMEASEDDAALAAACTVYIEMYLSQEHVNNRSIGCPMTALGSELARASGTAKKEAADAVDRLASLLQQDGDIQKGYRHLALLIGAVTLARLVDDTSQAQSILDAAASGIQHLK